MYSIESTTRATDTSSLYYVLHLNQAPGKIPSHIGLGEKINTEICQLVIMQIVHPMFSFLEQAMEVEQSDGPSTASVDTKQEIHEENLSKMAAMSEAEILAEQQKLLSMLGIVFVNCRLTIVNRNTFVLMARIYLNRGRLYTTSKIYRESD